MRNKIFVMLAGIMVVVGLAACETHNKLPAGQALENQQQAQNADSLVNNQPLPHFNYSQIRQNLIELEQAQANGVQTTSFFFNQGVVDPHFICPSIGAPIATTTQLSNPQQVTTQYNRSNIASGVIGNMDPSGIYTGDSTGTYVMCVDAGGHVYANYWEGFVQTVFGPASWDETTHTVKLVGAPTGGFTKK